MERITIDQMPSTQNLNHKHLVRYVKFINSRPERDHFVETGFSRHHIIPKSLGGVDVDYNMVKLTNREHFIAHMILWKCGYLEMARAFWMMSHDSNYLNALSSKQYCRLRAEFSILKQSIPKGFSFAGHHHTQLAKSAIRDKLSGSNSPHYGKTITEEHRLNLHLSHLGNIPWNKGVKRSPEQNARFEKPVMGVSKKELVVLNSCSKAKERGSPTATCSCTDFNKASGRDQYNNKIYWFFVKDVFNNPEILFENTKRKAILLQLFSTEARAVEKIKEKVLTILNH